MTAATNTMTGVGVVGLTSPSPLSKRQYARRSSPSFVRMAISLDEKKKNYTLQKSEEAFAIAKVPSPC